MGRSKHKKDSLKMNKENEKKPKMKAEKAKLKMDGKKAHRTSIKCASGVDKKSEKVTSQKEGKKFKYVFKSVTSLKDGKEVKRLFRKRISWNDAEKEKPEKVTRGILKKGKSKFKRRRKKYPKTNNVRRGILKKKGIPKTKKVKSGRGHKKSKPKVKKVTFEMDKKTPELSAKKVTFEMDKKTPELNAKKVTFLLDGEQVSSGNEEQTLRKKNLKDKAEDKLYDELIQTRILDVCQEVLRAYRLKYFCREEYIINGDEKLVAVKKTRRSNQEEYDAEFDDYFGRKFKKEKIHCTCVGCGEKGKMKPVNTAYTKHLWYQMNQADRPRRGAAVAASKALETGKGAKGKGAKSKQEATVEPKKDTKNSNRSAGDGKSPKRFLKPKVKKPQYREVILNLPLIEKISPLLAPCPPDTWDSFLLDPIELCKTVLKKRQQRKQVATNSKGAKRATRKLKKKPNAKGAKSAIGKLKRKPNAKGAKFAGRRLKKKPNAKGAKSAMGKLKKKLNVNCAKFATRKLKNKPIAKVAKGTTGKLKNKPIAKGAKGTTWKSKKKHIAKGAKGTTWKPKKKQLKFTFQIKPSKSDIIRALLMRQHARAKEIANAAKGRDAKSTQEELKKDTKNRDVTDKQLDLPTAIEKDYSEKDIVTIEDVRKHFKGQSDLRTASEKEDSEKENITDEQLDLPTAIEKDYSEKEENTGEQTDLPIARESENSENGL